MTDQTEARRVAAGEAHVTVPIEWDFKQSQAFDERTMSWRYKITATPTKYASVPCNSKQAGRSYGRTLRSV